MGKDTTFPCNFQSFREKCRDGDKEKNEGASLTYDTPSLIFSLFDEANAYFFVISHFAVPSAQLTSSLMS